MNREGMIAQLGGRKEFDICIIGGGATGLGIAVDAASRGCKTVLLEKYDFAKGTSSRSTKLVHGGVRYLQQGNIKLVMEALKERGLLRKNAPHLVKNQSFVIPNYKWWENSFYGIGLKVYDWMAGSLGLGPSQFLNKEETLAVAPNLDKDGLRGGVLYHDGQFDDARLAVHLAMTAADHGAVVLNYMGVEGLMKENGKVCGVIAKDQLTDAPPGSAFYEIRAKVVINATGIFSDSITKMDDHAAAPLISHSQGIHLVFDKDFLLSDTAIMIPRTDDGRVLFAVPWHNKIIVGTTDTPVNFNGSVETGMIEPIAFKEEIEFVMQHIHRYLKKDPSYNEIRSVFAGLRPLVKSNTKITSSISRDHNISVSDSELISITGGKWTTYRKMAEDVMEIAIHKAGMSDKECVTRILPIHGSRENNNYTAPLYYYGADEVYIHESIKKESSLAELIHPALPYIKAELVWAIKSEMCMTVEDALARRTRALLLDANAAIESASLVANLMAKEMGKDRSWTKTQIDNFNSMAKNYLPNY
ncbi:MAG TPA: glycerol-3-phosphate dehydrogenase/oxidase [Chitinophagaceae bacterium]|nr:glycerol-3-phosphate dehydrogenase/oxidase [Chitinophagaceae bacterium]